MAGDCISKQFLGDTEAAGPLTILHSDNVHFSLRNLLLPLKIYLYFFLGGGRSLAFSTVASVQIVSVCPSSALFPAQASHLHIQMLSGNINVDSTSISTGQVQNLSHHPLNSSFPMDPTPVKDITK